MANIGKRTLAEKKRNHPWLTERGVEAVARRDAARGTDAETEAVLECSEVLKQERERYIARTSKKIQEMNPS